MTSAGRDPRYSATSLTVEPTTTRIDVGRSATRRPRAGGRPPPAPTRRRRRRPPALAAGRRAGPGPPGPPGRAGCLRVDDDAATGPGPPAPAPPARGPARPAGAPRLALGSRPPRRFSGSGTEMILGPGSGSGRPSGPRTTGASSVSAAPAAGVVWRRGLGARGGRRRGGARGRPQHVGTLGALGGGARRRRRPRRAAAGGAIRSGRRARRAARRRPARRRCG